MKIVPHSLKGYSTTLTTSHTSTDFISVLLAKLKSLFFFIPFLFLTITVQAQVGTSFEEPTGLDAMYIDTGDPTMTHALINNPAQPLVNYVYAGGELGFSATFIPTRTGSSGAAGMTDGDEVGVTTETSLVTSYPDGSQGYKFEDIFQREIRRRECIAHCMPCWPAWPKKQQSIFHRSGRKALF